MGSSPFAELRNGREAVRLAEKASGLLRDKDPHALSVLGVAQAEYGSFRRAVDAVTQAIKLYEQTGDTAKSQALRNRLNMFKQSKPYRDE
jgi:Flp pilus assembly protein TadD